MSRSASALRTAVARPAAASRGSRAQRTWVIVYVGVTTGLLAAMAHYVTLHGSFAPPWTGADVWFSVIVLAGVLTKLLAAGMRTSAAAIIVACVAGLGFSIAFAVAPYSLLAIDTVGGYALVVPVGRAVLAYVGEQFPLQFVGYLLGVVYHGLTA